MQKVYLKYLISIHLKTHKKTERELAQFDLKRKKAHVPSINRCTYLYSRDILF